VFGTNEMLLHCSRIIESANEIGKALTIKNYSDVVLAGKGGYFTFFCRFHSTDSEFVPTYHSLPAFFGQAFHSLRLLPQMPLKEK